MKYLLVFLLSIQNVFALEVKYLEQGQNAPYTGYLISPETENHFRLIDTELQFQTKLNNSLTIINKSYEQTITVMQNRIDLQQQRVEELYSRENSIWGKLGFFLLGAAAATLITFGVAKASK